MLAITQVRYMRKLFYDKGKKEIERAEILIKYNNLYNSKIKPAKLLLDLNEDSLSTFHTTKSNLYFILEIINHKKEKIIDEMGLQSFLNLEAY